VSFFSGVAIVSSQWLLPAWVRGSWLFSFAGEKEVTMATYIALVNFTDQGVRQIRHTTERAKALINAASNLGVKIKDIYWTMGALDAVLIAEAADAESVMAFATSIGSLGNIRTQSLRAFTAEEMNKILDKIPAGKFTPAK
jgi:uncharacterized protein with GYD domain